VLDAAEQQFIPGGNGFRPGARAMRMHRGYRLVRVRLSASAFAHGNLPHHKNDTGVVFSATVS
jgi:hypothetical protein